MAKSDPAFPPSAFVIVNGADIFPLDKAVMNIGRMSDNDIVLANNTVSKLHTYFLVSEKGDAYDIVDANSTNGTVVNNKQLVAYKNQPLVNRDNIHFGPSIQMVYLTPEGFYELLLQLHRSGLT